MLYPNYMSGEKPFNPEDENARAMDYNDFLSQLTPEQRAAMVAKAEAVKPRDSLHEARENIQAKKDASVRAVEEQEQRQREEQKNDNDFLCQELAGAVDQGDHVKLDLFVNNFLKDQTAFEKPANLGAIQKIFDQVATNTEDQVIIGELPVENIRIGTVYEKVSMADGTIKPIGITIKADFSFGKDRPAVSFTVLEIPPEPKQNLEASAPLKPVKNKVVPPNQSKTLIQKMTSGLRGLFGSKK